MIDKAYKCRLYPNKKQAALIEKSFGCCRMVYNLALELSIAYYQLHKDDPSEEMAEAHKALHTDCQKKRLSAYDLMKMLPKWKSALPWLKDVSAHSLQQSIRDLDRAYQNFFRRVKRGEKPGFPKWKSKKSHTQSFRMTADGRAVRVIDDRHVKLPKLGKVRCRITQPIEGRILSATIKRVPSGKYYVIICCTDVPDPQMPMGDIQVMGIDAGLRDLMIRSDGVKVPNPRFARRMKRKVRREQRKLSRRKKGSANWHKQRVKVAKLNERIANQRQDYIHKATTEIVKASMAVATESLNVSGMAKDRHIAYSVGDASMAEAIRQIEYKCRWYGRDFVKVDRWFPSSKTCGNCGEVFKDLKRGDKHWTCPSCGTRHDRDLNAARNIARQGEILLYG